MDEEEQPPLIFKTSGNMMKELGRESISNQNVAILELLKNSYDAKSTKVEINFEGINTQNPKLEISDNGNGMTYEDLTNKWMVLASPHKRVQVTNGKRVIMGQKGLGRLASESIGSKTILITKPENTKEGFKVVFDWNEYEKKNTYIDQVKNSAWKFPKNRDERGTTLIISELRQPWNDNAKLKALLKDIYLLSPINNKPKNFDVKADKGFASVILEKPTQHLLESAVYRLKARLIKSSVIKYSFYKNNELVNSANISLENSLSCGDSTFELYFYYRSKPHYEKRTNKKISKKEFDNITKFLDEYNGIRIYRDNFQVKPYGDAGDWLGLELAAQNNTMCPRTIQSIGFINISKDKNPQIVDTTTREGIISTKQFDDLKKFVYTSITELFVDERSKLESDKKKANEKYKNKQKQKLKINQPITTLREIKILNVNGNLHYPESFYNSLENEINSCYTYNLPNATLFLWRKMIENLLVNILQKKFPRDYSLWFNEADGKHLKLYLLNKNMYGRRTQFKSHVRSEIETLNSLLGIMKETNSVVHNVFDYLSDRSELDRFRMEDIIQLLINIYSSID